MQYKNKKHSIYKDRAIFGAYLAGLWEGDGSILVKSKEHLKPTINITLHKNQSIFAEKLLQILSDQCEEKVGSIHYHKTRQACYLNIYSKQGLLNFIDLVNGKLRTPKASQLELVVNWLSNQGIAISKLPLCLKPIDHDAWYAGFIDADGSFGIRQTFKNKTIKKQTECQFILVQRVYYPKTGQSYFEIFTKIADFFCVKLGTLTARNPNALDQYKIKISSAKSKKILRAYLDKFPLLSSKYLDYKAWSEVDDLMIKKHHYTDDGVIKIAKIKKSMNNLRVNYNWKHLGCL